MKKQDQLNELLQQLSVLQESAMTVKNMTKKQIQIFFERLREQRPNPKTELNYSNPFELLVAVTYQLKQQMSVSTKPLISYFLLPILLNKFMHWV
jgi:hypothetical protein